MTAEQEVLFRDHYAWALKIANRLAQRSHLRPDEAEPLKNAALVGLIQAAQRFEPERGLAFTTLAGTRIAGAVTDCLRAESWVPRGALRKDSGKPECWKDLAPLQKVSLNQPIGHSEKLQIQDRIRLQMRAPALDTTEEVEWLLAALPATEQFVIRQYYLQDESMKAIGEALGLTESRVCQIHAAAMARLRRESFAMSARSERGSKD